MNKIITAIYIIGIFGCQSNVPKFDKKKCVQLSFDQTDLGPRNPVRMHIIHAENS